MTTAFRWMLRLPLEMKLLIPNLLVIGIAVAVFFGAASRGHWRETLIEYVAISILIVGAGVNFMLVRLALKPVKAIQLVAEQVAEGNLAARVRPSIIADTGLARLAVTFNRTLEYLSETREEIRERGARIVYDQERERSDIARALHESIGQTLAAASYQAAAGANASHGREAGSRALEVVRLLRTAMDDLRNLSRELHPRVADDLGLPAALESLTRSTMDRSLLDVQLSVTGFNESIPSAATSMFYRIAQEVLSNIEGSSTHGSVTIVITSDQSAVQLEINDDCLFEGINGRAVRAPLAALAERLSLLGGELLVGSNLLGGTRVKARLKRQKEAA